MVALLQQMPTLDSAAYRQLVSKSAGHAHGKETAVEADMRGATGRKVAPADAHHQAPKRGRLNSEVATWSFRASTVKLWLRSALPGLLDRKWR